ncbi:GumC family protein [Lichenifustis flavocetrariae]|uniref:Exopolysaccharide transport family protein n=1 Tax=Lichenifustis flavocetrariae TaxID=2949735 RepID=A0AA42CPH5_9HYPH|nr:exopolysaccharide transport family protein [Lichenifustis flavocetrariae]MCW6510400.1 exopolysaccharide transport family protein [Lichenifustis flavocetrariae]
MVSDLHDDELPGDGLPRRDLDVSYLGRRLKAQKRWLIGPALVCFVVSAVAVNLIAPRYTAETKVLIQSQEAYFTRLGNADTQAQPLPDDEAVQSQVQLVSSRDLARQAIKALDLKGNPEFDPLANGVGPVSRLLILLGLQRDPLGTPSEERILPNYFDRLTVFPVTKSRVLTIEFESRDADLAARAANTVASLYLDVQSSAKREAAHTAAESLRGLVADLRTRSAEAEAKAQAFRSESGLLLGANNNSLSSQQLTDMTTQLAQARSTEAEAQARAKLIRDMVRAGRITEVPDVANNDLIRRLSEQRAALQAEAALQGRTLLPGHPRMQELTAQLANIDAQLRTVAEKVVRGLDSDARIAQGRVDNLTTAINTQKDAVGAAGPDQVKLGELDLNARLLKDQLEFNTSKYQEALARENAGSNPADARIISRAVAPQLPSFPKKLPIITIMTIAGALLSLGILIARELLSGRAFARSDRGVSLPISLPEEFPARFAEEPALKPTFDPRAEPDAVVAATDSAMMRPARSSDPIGVLVDELAALKQPEQALRVLVLDVGLSARSNTVAVRLGRALSRSSRTIAVDLASAAGRIATPHGEMTGTAKGDGLAELLDGRASFAEVIHRDSQSRLHLIQAGVLPASGADLETDQEGIANVLDALAETYDHVLMSGIGASGVFAGLLAQEHTDVLVLASDESVGATRRDACRAILGLDEFDDLPVLTVELAGDAVELVSHGEAA